MDQEALTMLPEIASIIYANFIVFVSFKCFIVLIIEKFRTKTFSPFTKGMNNHQKPER
jgi:hypothetical protein